MPEAWDGSHQIDDAELRQWIERLADELCLTVQGNFDHLVKLDVTDDTLEKLQVLVNFVLDNARRATEAKREADRLAKENVNLLDKVGRIRRIGNYELEELLGRGGMGEVWRGQHRMLARPAAIKLIKHRELAQGDSNAANRLLLRFEREANATAALRSPHTVQVYDFGVHEGIFYYVMELLEGVDLRTLVEKQGPQPPERVVFLIRQACHSLYEAHLSGLVHRDVKPSNLFTCRYGIDYDFLKVLDFGLVKGSFEDSDTRLTQEGSVSGTPGFMAPEQVLGRKTIDHRADLYSLGCTAYYLLTGRQVFQDETPIATMFKHVNDQPIPLSEATAEVLPEGLESTIMGCLEKEPARRPQTAQELNARLEELDLAEQWTPQQRQGWWQRWLQEIPSQMGLTQGGIETVDSPPRQ